MPVTELHRQVAGIALEVAGRYGFVVGGGNALILHGLIDRPTSDLDLVTDLDGGVKAAAEAVEEALQDAGFTVQRQEREAGGLADVFYGFELGLAEWIVTSPAGEQMVLQITRMDRHRNPVIMDVGPVLDLEDALASKTAALGTRAEEKDFWDVAAALSRYTPSQLINLARQVDPGLGLEDFADAGRRLDRLPDRVFARFGLTPQDVVLLRERFAVWPRS
jgi:predicted nucleotidyltransferase component of viral defense system